MEKTSKIFTLLLIVITFKSSAQIIGEKLEFGLGLSPSVSWVTSNSKIIKSNGSEINWGFGARINYKLSEKYAFGFEVNLQNIASNIHFDLIDVKPQNGILTTSTDFNIDYRLRYVEVPCLLKMHTQNKNNLSFYGEFGFAPGFLLKQRADIRSPQLNLEDVNTGTPDDGDKFELQNADGSKYTYAINSLRVGLVFGAGTQLYILNDSRVDLGLRYNMGLSDFLDESKWNAANSYLSLNAGFFF
ncbi:MAG: porin family protein [Bacteroidota bacterium]|nr:porin family protein [Bacteroidota bacterium]